jgi:peptidoglycan/xylan/chitin deacetylase (PgdA/CDA1 family)
MRIPTPPANSVVALSVPILMYHYISANPNWPLDPARTRLSVPAKAFAAQLRYLQRAGYTTITLDDLAAALRDGSRLPSQPVVLTFDDGYQDFYDNAYPLLRKYGDKATIYIITNKVGLDGYMTWRELRELAASPLITIGAHTRTHPDLKALPARRIWDEMSGSKFDLERRLGIAVRHFAYPSGEYNTTAVMDATKIGFETAVTTNEGVEERADQLLTLKRVRVNGYATLADLIEGLTGRRSLRQHPVVTGPASPLRSRQVPRAE